VTPGDWPTRPPKRRGSAHHGRHHSHAFKVGTARRKPRRRTQLRQAAAKRGYSDDRFADALFSGGDIEKLL